jgi:hypothetical protein
MRVYGPACPVRAWTACRRSRGDRRRDVLYFTPMRRFVPLSFAIVVLVVGIAGAI